jgi:hypothetical protein
MPGNRNCFWSIAGYSFIYNDPFKWKIIYEANKSKLLKLDNPRLIHVGQLFEIPSIANEKREGIYDPALQYPSFGK